MLLKITDTYPANFGLIVTALLLGLAGLVTLFALSVHWLLERRTRKRGLIALGAFLLVSGVIALAILL